MIQKITPSDWNLIYNTTSASGLIITENFVNMVKLNIQPHSVIDEHSLPVDVIFFILNGTGKIKIDEVTFSVKTNDTVSCPSNKMRSWQNDNDSVLEILVIKNKD